MTHNAGWMTSKVARLQDALLRLLEPQTPRNGSAGPLTLKAYSRTTSKSGLRDLITLPFGTDVSNQPALVSPVLICVNWCVRTSYLVLSPRLLKPTVKSSMRRRFLFVDLALTHRLDHLVRLCRCRTQPFFGQRYKSMNSLSPLSSSIDFAR